MMVHILAVPRMWPKPPRCIASPPIYRMYPWWSAWTHSIILCWLWIMWSASCYSHHNLLVITDLIAWLHQYVLARSDSCTQLIWYGEVWNNMLRFIFCQIYGRNMKSLVRCIWLQAAQDLVISLSPFQRKHPVKASHRRKRWERCWGNFWSE